MSSAIQYWKDRIEAHHAQSLKVQAETSWSQGDFWRPFAQFFKQDPRRSDDPMLDILYPKVTPDTTVLDVGGGAGRIALPLALKSKHVTVAEPSESMVEALRESAQEAGIENISVVQDLWEDAKVEQADVVLCAHVLYGVADAEPFIRKLEASARDSVMILAFMRAPISRVSPFWEPVHGEKRIDMPGLTELLPLLWEMEIYPNVEMLEPSPVRGFESEEQAFEQLNQRLYVKPGTGQEEKLRQAIEDLLVETADGLVVKGVTADRQGLITWRPA